MTDIVKADAVEVMGTDPVQQLFAMADRLDPEALERMVALAERVQAANARQAYIEAFNAFQAECPVINKDAVVSYKTKAGRSIHRRHATLAEIQRTVHPVLAKNGLAYRFSTVDGNVVCTLSHSMGHEESAAFPVSTAWQGDMNESQKHASGQTFAMRYALVQVLALATAEDDVDGDQPAPDNATITKQQAERVMEMIDKAGAEAGDRVLKWARVSKVADLPASKYGDAMYSLQRAAEQNNG